MSNRTLAIGNFCLSSNTQSACPGQSQHPITATAKVLLPGVILKHLQRTATIVTERCWVVQRTRGSSQTAAPIPAALVMTQYRYVAVPSSTWHFPLAAPKVLCKGGPLQFSSYRAGTWNVAINWLALLTGDWRTRHWTRSPGVHPQHGSMQWKLRYLAGKPTGLPER